MSSCLAHALGDETAFFMRHSPVKRTQPSSNTAGVSAPTNTTAPITANTDLEWDTSVSDESMGGPSGSSSNFESGDHNSSWQVDSAVEASSVSGFTTLAQNYYEMQGYSTYLPDNTFEERVSGVQPDSQDTLPGVLIHLLEHYKICFSLVRYRYTDPDLIFHPRGERSVDDDYDLMVRADVLGAIRRMANDLPDLSSSLPTMNDSTDAGYVPPMNRLVDETQSGEHEVPASLCIRTTQSNTVYRHGSYTGKNRDSKIHNPYERVGRNTSKFRHGRTSGQTATSSSNTSVRPTYTQDDVRMDYDGKRRMGETDAYKWNDNQVGRGLGYAHTANWMPEGTLSTQDSPPWAVTTNEFSSHSYSQPSSRQAQVSMIDAPSSTRPFQIPRSFYTQPPSFEPGLSSSSSSSSRISAEDRMRKGAMEMAKLGALWRAQTSSRS